MLYLSYYLNILFHTLMYQTAYCPIDVGNTMLKTK